MKTKDYALAEALSFLLTILFAPITAIYAPPWSREWWFLQIVNFLAINFVIIIIYNWLFTPPQKAPEVPNIIDAFDEGIINSKYNFCSTSTKEVALWGSPTFLYYLNLNTLKSISEATKGSCNAIFSTKDEDKKAFYDNGINILRDCVSGLHSGILSKYTGIRFLIYPKEVFEKNKEEIRALISIHALGRIYCIPVIREALLNRLNDVEKETLHDLSNKLNQRIVDEYAGLSRADRFKLSFSKSSPYKDTIPDYLIIDSYSIASRTAVWWYEKNKPQSSSDSAKIAAAQECFRIISKKVLDEKEALLWEEFIPSIFNIVPVVVMDIEGDFFSKMYYENWLNSIVPKYPKLKQWIRDQEEGYLKRLVSERAIDKALDIGCGWGRHMSILLENGVNFCAGIDVSPSMIRKANYLYDKYGNDKVLIKLEDAQKLSFKNEFFDLAVCMTNTFGNMTEEVRQKAMSEIYRVLKHGGTFILSVYRDSPIARETREKSYIEVGLRPYPVDDPSVVMTQEGLSSKEFTYREINNYLKQFKNIERTEVNEFAFIVKADK